MAKAKTQAPKKGMDVRPALAVVAAGLAAGYYFYASKDAPKHRKIASKWANELKGDVVKQAKKLQKVDKKTVAGVIDSAAKAYSSARNLDKKQVAQAARELKANWDKVVKEVGGTKKVAKKSVAKVAKKRTPSKKTK